MVKEHHGLLFATVGALLTALSAILVRWADTVPITTILFVRFALSSLCVFPLLWSRKVTVTEMSVRKHMFRAVFGLISMGCYFYSITHLSVMNAITFLNTAPLFLPLVVFFWLKKIIPAIRVTALFVGFIGVILILRPSVEMNVSAAFIGLLGGFCLAVVQIGIRNLSKTESTETILVHYFLIATLLVFFPMIYFWHPIHSLKIWILLILIGIVSLLFQYCFTRSLHAAPSTKVSAVNYLAVPMGGMLGWWFFHEIPPPIVFIGTCLIVLGGVIAVLSKQESRPRF